MQLNIGYVFELHFKGLHNPYPTLSFRCLQTFFNKGEFLVLPNHLCLGDKGFLLTCESLHSCI